MSAHSAVIGKPVVELETAILRVLLAAPSARAGAANLLEVWEPFLDGAGAAIAVRDHDRIALIVLAKSGESTRWPAVMEPEFAWGGQPGVDSATGCLVSPLRAKGRVIGAFLLEESDRARALLRDPNYPALADATAAVLASLLARTDAAVRRQGRALCAEDQVVEGMAFQLTNPLANASTLARMLAEEIADEEQKATLAQVAAEISRAFGVIQDMLDLPHHAETRDEILDLGAFVERLVRTRAYAIRELGLTLEVESPLECLPVRIAPATLAHALLVALRFAELRARGTAARALRVRVAAHGDSDVVVAVSGAGEDELPVIAPGYFDLPFDEGLRSDGRDAPDLGLINSMLRGCGGQLQARSDATTGATLYLLLPLAAIAAPSAARHGLARG